MGIGEKVNDRELKLLAHSHAIHMQSPAIETLTKFLSTITDASCGSQSFNWITNELLVIYTYKYERYVYDRGIDHHIV